MTVRSRAVISAAAICISTLLSTTGGAAQSPGLSSPSPTVACPSMTGAGSPLHAPGSVLITAFGGEDPTSPDAATAPAGRFQPGDVLGYPGDPSGVPVFAIGNGRVVAAGPIAGGNRGGIVVVEHDGSFLVPVSTPGAPYAYPALQTDMLLSAYEGIDPSPDLAVGACVGPDTQLGVTTARCGPGVNPPCSDAPARLQLELRLPSTADPGMRSADWSSVGATGDFERWLVLRSAGDGR